MTDLIHADCLDWCRTQPDKTVDLVYCDGPLFAQQDFCSFDDRWRSRDEYVQYMAERLDAIRLMLKPTGSLWLHCDYHAGHYLKVELDRIFGEGCFRNEVIWRYRRWPAKSRHLQRMHDTLFWYSREPDGYIFHELYGYESLAPSTMKTFGTRKQKADFASGHRKPSVEAQESKGPPLSDVWEIGVIAPIAKERTGYPTQKPEKLLERVILATSNPGDLVLDPMCGSGTTGAVATRLGRRFIGIDRSEEAIRVASSRLGLTCGKYDGSLDAPET